MNNLLSFENDDLLNRKQIAENLTEIIKCSDDINVVAIDSAWGTGKTTFIEMWRDMLTNEKYKHEFETLYFNAWENDYTMDPFAALLIEIERETSNDFKEAFKGAFDVGKNIVKAVINVGLKVGTAGAVGTDEFKGENIKNSIFKALYDEKDTREKFIELLEGLAINNKKIIFFIDEIDRCRPTFAIELLEVIKHLFKAKNIFFVISLDKEQLGHSVKTLYGEGMDSSGYLRRFFDLEFRMPIINKGDYCNVKSKELDKYKCKYLIEDINKLIIRDDYSLRDIDRIYKYVKIFISSTKINMLLNRMFNDDEKVVSYILAFLINLKIKHTNMYKKIVNLDYKEEDINEILTEVNDLKLIRFAVNNNDKYQMLYQKCIEKFLYLNLWRDRNVLLELRRFNSSYDFFDIIISNVCECNLYNLNNSNNLSLINKLEMMDNFDLNSF